jgi:hypothetical protein
MNDMPFRKTIGISQCLLDYRNPRLPEIQASQREAIRAMTSAQPDKILAMAEHLVNNGPNPATLPIVMPSVEDTSEFYVVLDGNRRITALRLLDTPQLVESTLDQAKLRKLKELSTMFREHPITELSCVVVASRDQADTWIQLIHRGQNLGAGLVEWDGQVAARYDARKGSKPAALQVLDYVSKHSQLSEKARERIDKGKFPITNLERLIKTPYVRKKLGVDLQDGQVVITHPEEAVLKGLTRVVDDIGSRQITVSDIKRQEQRIDYINSLSEDELPEADHPLPAAQSLGTSPPRESADSVARAAEPRGFTRQRKTLVPRDCRLNIEHHRVRKMFNELKKLDLEKYPNAGAVMLRVFLELSLDDFLEQTIRWTEQQIRNSFLAQKLTTVVNYFESNGIMTASQLAPVKKAAAGQTLLAAAVKTMHQYVHNRHFSPVASELKIAWDDLRPFIQNLWPE